MRSLLLLVVRVTPWVGCNPRRLCEFRSFILLLSSRTLLGGSNSLWSSPTFVYRFGQRLQVDLTVERANPSRVKLTENRVSTSVLLECLGGSTPLQRRRTSIGKELRETSPRVHFAVTSLPKPFTYAFTFVIAFVLEVIYLAIS